MRKFFILIIVFSLYSCKEDSKLNRSEKSLKKAELVISKSADTLISDRINFISYLYDSEYQNYEINKNRFIKIYYIIQDSVYNKRIEDLSNYDYEAFENVLTNDTLKIKSFGHVGDKVITFIFLDVVEIAQGDSIRFKYIETKFTHKTFVK
ncbi:hypothetical protein [Flavobacterium sp. HSC-61S13]|uniref:hypothetical protein n=1 Tax=Flavobacterium sp. HSC-61S13 TaxID=2910963 RepID=UPI0020A02603|nr:hypothetical protein [Flavobacterium sp. HSC-61S13]MCP1995117.1 hypothetical protein [Flavobacterium sp. HSC-61S13]